LISRRIPSDQGGPVKHQSDHRSARRAGLLVLKILSPRAISSHRNLWNDIFNRVHESCSQSHALLSQSVVISAGTSVLSLMRVAFLHENSNLK